MARYNPEKPVLWKLAALAVLAITVMVRADGAQAGAPLVLRADVMAAKQKAEKDGRTQVLLRLSPETYGGGDFATSSTEVQRARVSRARGQVLPALTRDGMRILRTYRTLPVIAVEVTPEQAAALQDMAGVNRVFLNRRERPVRSPVDPQREGSLLASSTATIDLSDAHDAGYRGAGVTVAVIDTGIETSRPDFSGRVVQEACFSSDFLNDTFNMCPSGSTPEIGPGAASNCPFGSDRCDHGTNVSGIAVGGVSSRLGIAPEANLIAIDVFSEVTDAGECDPDPTPCELTDSIAILDALDYINDNAETYNIAAVNLSVGGGSYSEACDSDVRADVAALLRAKGVAVVAAASNEGYTGQISAPACISSIIAVGSTNDNGTISSFSNFSDLVDLMAPGESITAAGSSSSTITYSGTSQATPHVAGAFALLKAAVPDASVDAILDALRDTGDPVTRAGSGVSVPRIQVNAALRSLLDGVDVRLAGILPGETANASSYLRFYNSSDDAGTVTVILYHGRTGEELGRWTSETIAAGASLQMAVSIIETEATPVIPDGSAAGYVAGVSSTFEGLTQHVVWNRQEGTFADLTACDVALTDASRLAINVHTSVLPAFPSYLRIFNTDDSAGFARLSLYDSRDGSYAGEWYSTSIPARSYLTVPITEIEAEGDGTFTPQAPFYHYNVQLDDDDFIGRLTHLVLSTTGQSYNDISRYCALSGS